jgi:hypothetical protein
MKYFLCFLNITVSFVINAQNWQWLQPLHITHSPNSQQYHPYFIKADAAGNTYLAGFIPDTIKMVSGQIVSAPDSTLFVLKLNSSGQYVWSRKIEGVTLTAFTLDDHANIIIAGCLDCTYPYNSTMNNYLLKIDSSGGIIWKVKIIARGHCEVTYLQADITGNIYIKGLSSDTIQLGNVTSYNPMLSPFISKCNSNGNFYWIKNYPLSLNGGANTIVTNQNMFIQTADSLVTLDTSGNILAKNIVIRNSYTDLLRLISDSNGNLYVAGVYDDVLTVGSYTLTAVAPCTQGWGGCGDIFLFKMNPQGQIAWAKTIYSYATDIFNDILISADGCINLTGSHYQPLHIDTLVMNTYNAFFISKISNTGRLVSVTEVDNLMLWDSKIAASQNDLFVMGEYKMPEYYPPICIYFGVDSICNYTGYFAAKLAMKFYNSVSLPNQEEYRVFPNPSTGKFRISASNQILRVRAYDSYGQQVLESYDTEIDLSNQPKGIFFLEIIQSNGRTTYKVITE